MNPWPPLIMNTLSTAFRALQACACAALLLPAPARAAAFSEPQTVFYGRVLGVGAGQPARLTSGQLVWTLHRADGAQFTLRTTLYDFNEQYSYRLDVPHEALSIGLSNSAAAVPLRAIDDLLSHGQITLDGRPARLLGPAAPAFTAAQARRGATYRLDLAVPLAMVDVDGNGLADAWETLFGQHDPLADPDGDGRNNLAEFKAGTRPDHDDRLPELVTRAVRAYAGGTSLVYLRATDLDSAPTHLTYTVVRPPANGQLRLRNATPNTASPDLALAAGASFTQADVNRGRLVYLHRNGDASFTTFDLSLRDEDPAHPAATNRVQVFVYNPAPDLSDPERSALLNALPARMTGLPGRPQAEEPFLAGFVLGRDRGFLVGDASTDPGSQTLQAPSAGLALSNYQAQFIPQFGLDRRHILIGGPGDDRLEGGMEGDILIGGPGNDTLRGNGGPDLFVLGSSEDGSDVIEDFSVAEGDTLDLSGALSGSAPSLTNYLQVTVSGTNTLLRINSSGSGPDFTNLVLTLWGAPFSASDLAALLDSGRIITGGRMLPPRVSIAASVPTASENGPTPGAFLLTRSGSTASDLAVSLQVTGSAANGTDYQLIPPLVTIPAGARDLVIPVMPYEDALTELTEAVEVAVAPGAGYTLGAAVSARVNIEDLAPMISIEALEPLAIRSDLSPGLFLVTRSGVLDRSVFVRLILSGTASNGLDYNRVNAYLNLAAGQTTELITITPKTAAVLAGGAEFVQISIKADPAYKIAPAGAARVLIVEQYLTLESWRARQFPGVSGPLDQFASLDPGGFGLPNFVRYAFNLDPAAPDRSQLPKPALRNGRLTVDLRRRREALDVDYTVEVSRDLRHWDASPASVEEVVPAPGDDPDVVTYRAVPAGAADSVVFMRVRVRRVP